jgi:transcriptional regulator with XRE-family HTH domain
VVYLNVYIMLSVNVSELLRGARDAAGLTQAELAARASTAQPAVAAYESGVRTPTIATLTRLLDACEHDLQVRAAARVRRGAASLAALAPQIAEDLHDGREHDALRLLFGFADDFRGSSRAGRRLLIGEEPPLTGDRRFDAALAGVAELFAAKDLYPPAVGDSGSMGQMRARPIAAPEWVDGPQRFVEPWWFVTSRPAFHAYTLAHTPAALARHGVFLAREVFDRA